jgi:anti-anti-sigma factor
MTLSSPPGNPSVGVHRQTQLPSVNDGARESIMDDVNVIHVAPDVAVVALHGEHDAMGQEELSVLLSDEINGNGLVVVDVSDADFIDSSVLHNLVRADRLARDHGSRMVLQVGTARAVRSAMNVSGAFSSLERADGAANG